MNSSASVITTDVELPPDLCSRVDKISGGILAGCAQRAVDFSGWDLWGPLSVMAPGSRSGILCLPRVEDLDVWVIGDVHADLRALVTCIEFIRDHYPLDPSRSESECKCVVVLLGDLIDRGKQDHAVLLYLHELLKCEDLEVVLIAGNHDLALGYKEAGDKTTFAATVEPAEYAEFLNSGDVSPECVQTAKSFVDAVDKAPVSVLICRDGTLLTHGGVPHTDYQKQLLDDSFKAFRDAKVQNDFVWSRLCHVQSRMIDRSSTSVELGSSDYKSFLDAFQSATGYEVTGVIRGHDHVLTNSGGRSVRGVVYKDQGWEPFCAITINAMSEVMDGEFAFDKSRLTSPCVVQCFKTSKGPVRVLHKLHMPVPVQDSPESVEETGADVDDFRPPAIRGDKACNENNFLSNDGSECEIKEATQGLHSDKTSLEEQRVVGACDDVAGDHPPGTLGPERVEDVPADKRQ